MGIIFFVKKEKEKKILLKEPLKKSLRGIQISHQKKSPVLASPKAFYKLFYLQCLVECLSKCFYLFLFILSLFLGSRKGWAGKERIDLILGSSYKYVLLFFKWLTNVSAFFALFFF